MHAKITDISMRDGYYDIRRHVIGKTGELKIASEKGGWTGGVFYFDIPMKIGKLAPKKFIVVYQIKYVNLDGKSARRIGFWGLTWLSLKLRFKTLMNWWLH